MDDLVGVVFIALLHKELAGIARIAATTLGSVTLRGDLGRSATLNVLSYPRHPEALEIYSL